MTSGEHGPTAMDYEDWLRRGNAEMVWTPRDPAFIWQAFAAGWTRGALYVAGNVSAQHGPGSLPKGMVDHLIGPGSIEAQSGQ